MTMIKHWFVKKIYYKYSTNIYGIFTYLWKYETWLNPDTHMGKGMEIIWLNNSFEDRL